MVFDDIAELADQDIQLILDETRKEDFAVGLKGGSEKLKERIWPLLSNEEEKEMKQKMDFSGPVRVSDVEFVQLGIVYRVLQLERDGKLTIPRENDPFV
jgi:flagellar motor switch protein FliG